MVFYRFVFGFVIILIFLKLSILIEFNQSLSFMIGTNDVTVLAKKFAKSLRSPQMCGVVFRCDFVGSMRSLTNEAFVRDTIHRRE